MKKTGKKILALVQCLVMCMSLLHGNVFATYGTMSGDGTSITEGTASSEMVSTDWGEIPANWHGYVMRYSYNQTSNVITIETGYFNLPYSSAYETFLKFDATKLRMLTSEQKVDDRGLSVATGVAISNMT